MYCVICLDIHTEWRSRTQLYTRTLTILRLLLPGGACGVVGTLLQATFVVVTRSEWMQTLPAGEG